MTAIAEQNKSIDVICQHTKDGDIIPMRIRVQDEDGVFQTFNIKGYTELSSPSQYLSPYGTIAHSHTWTFLCKIQVLNSIRTLELFYNSNDNLWKITKII